MCVFYFLFCKHLAGLYHGGQPIAPTQRTAAVAPVTDPTWNEDIVFDISLEDVPKVMNYIICFFSNNIYIYIYIFINIYITAVFCFFFFACIFLLKETRLCLTIHGMWNTPAVSSEKTARQPGVSVHELLRTKTTGTDTISLYASKRENRVTMAWVNTTLFDYCQDLRASEMSLACWPCLPEDVQDGANPIGTTVPNPDRNTAPLLNFKFMSVEKPTRLPTPQPSPQLAADLNDIKSGKTFAETLGEKDQERLTKIISKDPLARISKKEKSLLWKYRFFIKKDAKALPKFLRAIPWNKYEYVAQAHALLKVWERPSAEDALELLDSQFADHHVRAYAVECLDKLSDEQLLMYLSQLVQVLKYESFFDCDLARFLLRRALQNQRIGHFFYWYLRAEMHLPEVSSRFALLIEAYCRGCGSHMASLTKQVSAMDKLVQIANAIKNKALDTREKKLTLLRQELANVKFSPFQTPLNPTVVVSKLIPEKCSFMDSKKLPLWLVFENDDPDGEDVYIIFKAGDGELQFILFCFSF